MSLLLQRQNGIYGYNPLLIQSVGKKNWQLRLGKHASGHAAEDHLQQLWMRIGAQDQQIRSQQSRVTVEGPEDIAMLRWKIGDRHVLAVPREVSP